MQPAYDKPIDVGTGVVCASFAADGSWLSIGRLHERWGFVELSGLPPFAETGRGDPDETRRYRRLTTGAEHAWLRIEPVDGGRADQSAMVLGTPGTPRLTQRWEFGEGVERIVRVAGRLDRPALAEITEVNPPAPTGAVTSFEAEGGRLVIRAADLPATATVVVSAGRWRIHEGGAELRLGDDLRTVDVDVVLESGREPPTNVSLVPDEADWRSLPEAPRDHGIGSVVERALGYVRSCTALTLRPGERAMLTDHRLLPLAWTRDAYYQALLLLANGSPADIAIVADHLRWTWRRCERPAGRWMRSHHGNGRPKDLVFQADQQLYPVVELADYWRVTGTLPDGVDWTQLVPEAWRAVLGAVDPATALVATEENAADDRAEAPFVAGAQILLWYAATRLAELVPHCRIGIGADDLLATAAAVRAAFDRHLATGDRWAYATDGRGRRVDYHDANEFPTSLAPLWGFCAADDPQWRRTIGFAFSTENPGFVGGPAGGLGSRHTPGVWPLGHVQAWLAGRIVGDEAAAAGALARIVSAAFPDGMLPEAVVADGDAPVPIRHWFAWPGAAIGALWLLDQGPGLDTIAARVRRVRV